jgi:riboflavin kinase/FMN adenylyltransferase
MQLYSSFAEIERPHAAVCTVGTFDGVHLGHQHLLRALVDDAHTRGLPSAVLTFFPSPRVVLGRASALYLTLPEEKARQMELLGVDILVTLSFTRETIQTPAAEFVRLMSHHLRLVSLWIGPDFALGNKRQGDAAYLQEQGLQYGFGVNVLSTVNAGTESVSSTRIRTALARGDIAEANLCLGRAFQVIGAYMGEHSIHVPAQHALPAPGEYPVRVCGEPNRAVVTATATDSSETPVLQLRHPASCDSSVGAQVVVEFLNG